MRIRELTLSQFRNWTYRCQSFGSNLSYIYGPNGSGKTSLLEAVYYLGTGRSFRARTDKYCIKWENESFSLRGEFQPSDSDSVCSISLYYGQETKQGRKKIAKIDDEIVPKLSQLRQYVPIILFAPDDLQVIKKGPDLRRNFLDTLCMYLEAGYVKKLRQYDRARKQRNQLLKNADPDTVLMDQYESTMVEYGEQIINSRSNLMRLLERALSDLRNDADSIMDSSDDFSINYDPDVSPESSFRQILDERTANDIDRGYTVRGPHRDDWMLHIDDRPIDIFASQGELRLWLLLLKISASTVIMKSSNSVPIVLLDDMESELDSTHIKHILSLIDQHPSQFLITGTGDLKSSSFLVENTTISLEAG